MTYNKPQIHVLAVAIKAIAGDEKPPDIYADSMFPHPLNATVGAYQSDE